MDLQASQSLTDQTLFPDLNLYKPLDPITHEIRLLRIHPSGWREPIRCSFEHVSLNAEPAYHALSYTWQDESLGTSFTVPPQPERQTLPHARTWINNQAFVLLDGHHVEVTRNLWAALWHLRRTILWSVRNPGSQGPEFDETLTVETPTSYTVNSLFWIDALCINQENIEERNSQVAQMRTVYLKAESVHVWLGLEEPNTTQAIDILNSLALSGMKDAPADVFESVGKFFVRNLLKDHALDGAWKVLTSLYKRPYWKRLWIVQEFISNKTMHLHVGSRRIEGVVFYTLGHIVSTEWLNIVSGGIIASGGINEVVFKSLDFYRELGQAAIELKTLWSHRLNYEVKTDFDLLKLLSSFRTNECSDPRDRVYGIVGIAEPYENIKLKIDYSATVTEVYIATAEYIVSGSKSLHILEHAYTRHLCLCSTGKHIHSTLPSWVPDWQCTEKISGLPLLRSGIDWNCSRQLAANTTISTSGGVLRCQGLLLGKVEEVCRVLRWDQNSEITLSSLTKYFQNISAIGMRLLCKEGVPSDFGIFAGFKTLVEILFYIPNSGFEKQLQSAKEIILNWFISNASAQGDHYRAVDLNLDAHQLLVLELLIRCRDIFIASLSPISLPETTSKLNSIDFGICYPFCKAGDYIAILYGYKFPLVLRKKEDVFERFEIIGDVYIYGYMQGEAIGKFEERFFDIG